MPSRYEKILALQFKYFGDAVLPTPALRALRESYTDAELHVLVPAEIAPRIAVSRRAFTGRGASAATSAPACSARSMVSSRTRAARLAASLQQRRSCGRSVTDRIRGSF